MATSGRIRTALVLAVALAALPCHVRAQSAHTSAAPVLQDLRGLDELRTLFDRDRDKIRIVLLLSPT
jgi:hypothetical protein